MNAEAQEWFDSRPANVRLLFCEFPPGTIFSVEGDRVYLMGYVERPSGDPDLLVTSFDPSKNYDLAVAARVPLCLKHVRDGSATVEWLGVIP